MIEVLQNLEKILPDLDGWADVTKAQRLACLVFAIRPDVSVEIGVFGGRSFYGLALAHKHLGHGMAIGIDPWSNAAAMEGYEGGNQKYWQELNLNEIHDKFMATLEKQSVLNVTKIIRQKSDEVEPPEIIDLLHVDGQHTEQAVRDVARFAANVRMGGFVIMDDTSWTNGEDAPIQRAVALLKDMGFDSLYPLGTGEVFQRIK